LQSCGFSRDEINVVTRKNETKETDTDAGNANNIAAKRTVILPTELTTFIADAASLFIRGIGQVALVGPLASILRDTTGEVELDDLIHLTYSDGDLSYEDYVSA
jgi:hypothetical protein